MRRSSATVKVKGHVHNLTSETECVPMAYAFETIKGTLCTTRTPGFFHSHVGLCVDHTHEQGNFMSNRALRHQARP